MKPYSGTTRGIDIGSLCKNLVAEALSLQDSITVEFNEITLVATPKTNPEELMDFYFSTAQAKKN